VHLLVINNQLRWIFWSEIWGLDWIDLAQDRDRWRALVNTVMNLQVPWLMRIICWIPKATDTLSELINTNCSSTATMVKWKHLNVVFVRTLIVFFLYIFPFCCHLVSEGYGPRKQYTNVQQLDSQATVCAYCCGLPQYAAPNWNEAAKYRHNIVV
jgi:hypothetical protein